MLLNSGCLDFVTQHLCCGTGFPICPYWNQNWIQNDSVLPHSWGTLRHACVWEAWAPPGAAKRRGQGFDEGSHTHPYTCLPFQGRNGFGRGLSPRPQGTRGLGARKSWQIPGAKPPAPAARGGHAAPQRTRAGGKLTPARGGRLPRHGTNTAMPQPPPGKPRPPPGSGARRGRPPPRPEQAARGVPRAARGPVPRGPVPQAAAGSGLPSERGRRSEAPAGGAALPTPGRVTVAPRRRSPRAPLPGTAGSCRKGPFAALPGRAAAERQRCGSRAAAAPPAPHLGRSGPDRSPPPSAGRAGGTMITSAGERAARGSAGRRGFAESGPWLGTAAAAGLRGAARHGGLPPPRSLLAGRHRAPRRRAARYKEYLEPERREAGGGLPHAQYPPVSRRGLPPATGCCCGLSGAGSPAGSVGRRGRQWRLLACPSRRRVHLLSVLDEGTAVALPVPVTCLKRTKHRSCKARGQSGSAGGAAGVESGGRGRVWLKRGSELQMPYRGEASLKTPGWWVM